MTKNLKRADPERRNTRGVSGLLREHDRIGKLRAREDADRRARAECQAQWSE